MNLRFSSVVLAAACAWTLTARAYADDCNGNNIPDSEEISTCPAIDVVFIIDASGSMVGRLDGLCAAIEMTVAALTSQFPNIVVEKRTVYDNANPADVGCVCCQGNVVLTSTCTSTAKLEHWGAAVKKVAETKSWREGPRLIVPISDEGPACGDFLNMPVDDQDDLDAVTDAIAAALMEHVVVAPVTDDTGSALLQNLAYNSYPGGRILALDGPGLAEQLITLVGSLCPANCNADPRLDECEIALGASDYNHNRVPDSCEVVPPTNPAFPNNAEKNRYISFVPGNGSIQVSFQVKHVASGTTVWIAAPESGIEANNNIARLVEDGTFSSMPSPRVWTEQVIHATGCVVVPSQAVGNSNTGYEIRATVDGVTFSPALTVKTIYKPVPKFWADCVGSPIAYVFQAPNLLTDFVDINAAVQRFQNVPTAPPLTWVDINPEVPDVLVGFADINRIVQGFQGQVYPFRAPQLCPIVPHLGGFTSPGGEEESMAGGGGWFGPESLVNPIPLTVAVAPYQINEGQLVTIEAFIAGAVADMGTYEVALDITGNEAGQLTLESLTVDTQRSDYALTGHNTIYAGDLIGGRAGATIFSGTGASVTAPAYMATFTFRAGAEVSGVLPVRVRDPNTYLLDGASDPLPYTAVEGQLIRVGVECTSAAHCIDDGNPCTWHDCTAGACVYGNVTSGTACDDGLFCTGADTCNGSGLCTGTGNPCHALMPKCCENLDMCKGNKDSCLIIEE